MTSLHPQTHPPEAFHTARPGLATEYTFYTHTGKRVGRRSVQDALIEECAAFSLPDCAVFDGVEGFGDADRMRAQTLEGGGIPVVAGVTSPGDIGASLLEVADGSLLTASDITVLDADASLLRALRDAPAELTVHCRIGTGRDDPLGAGHVLHLLRSAGVAGATAFSGADGFVSGHREHDGVFRRSPSAPATVVAVDEARVLAYAVPSLIRAPNVTMLTARPVWVWKSRGRISHTPIADVEPDGARRLTIYTADDTHHSWWPLHTRLVNELRDAGAAGATVIRARLAYVLDDPVRPDRGFFARRGAPFVTTIVDSRERVGQWLEVADAVTGEAGLVTCASVRPV